MGKGKVGGEKSWSIYSFVFSLTLEVQAVAVFPTAAAVMGKPYIPVALLGSG